MINIKTHIDSYIDDLKSSLSLIDTANLQKILNLLDKTRNLGGRIFIAGNGGSSALANHFACDLGKNAAKDENNRFQIISVCDNMGSITAYGNDEGYENVFSEQLKNYFIKDNDVVFLISSSGNSPNVIKAAKYAKTKNSKVLSLTGFTGGKLRDLSDICIYINKSQYEPVEDVHGVVLHIIVSYFKKEQY